MQRKGGEKSGKGREGSGTGEDTKKAEPVRARLGLGRGVGSVSVQATVGTDAPCVNRWGWGGAYLARKDECLIGCGLGQL